MKRPHRLIASAALLVAAMLTWANGPAAPATAATVNGNPDYLVVYDNNVENLLGDQDASCASFRIGNLITYMAGVTNSPDLFFVQQISNSSQLAQLVSTLNSDRRLGGAVYAGVIAKASPNAIPAYNQDTPTGHCKYLKRFQTNAIIYRTDRLTLMQKDVVIADLSKTDKPADCRNAVSLDPAQPSQDPSQDRVIQIKAKFWDKLAQRSVNAVSMHWPTFDSHGTECALKNWGEVEQALANLGGASLYIAAGDVNVSPTAPSGSDEWWDTATAHGYRDPIAEICGGRDCPSDGATHKNDTFKGSVWHRYDVLLAKRSANVGDAFSKVATIPNAGSTAYSQHKAVVAYVKYRQD